MKSAHVLLAATMIVTLSCFSELPDPNDPDPGTTADCVVPGSAIGANRAVVLIRGFRFMTDTVRIRPGGRVTWVNCEPANIEAHTATSTDGVWDSGNISPGTSYSRDFPTAGVFNYFCRPHPGAMRAVVIVQ